MCLLHSLLLLPALGIKWKVRPTIIACISVPPSTINFLGGTVQETAILKYSSAHTTRWIHKTQRGIIQLKAPGLHSGGIFGKLR